MPAARDFVDREPGSGTRRRIALDLARLRRRSRATVRERLQAVRINGVLALQAGLAAALAWLVAVNVFGNPNPVFAPIAAVGTLASSVGQRLRNTIELIVGVALGIGIGDGLILLIGTGSWQIGLVVTLSIVAIVFLGGGPAVVVQAAATGILIATLAPSPGTLEFPRVIDALTGGVVGLAVVALLLPLNPLRVVDRAARPAVDTLVEQLTVAADALRSRDAQSAQAALDRLHGVQDQLDGLEEALHGGKETVILAPLRWHRKGALSRYVESAEYLNHIMHNSASLVRRAVTLLEDDEPVPPAMPSAVTQLAEAVRLLQHDLAAGLEPEAARERALRAVSEAGRAYTEGVGFSGSVVVAQIRTTVSDLLRATGLERVEANQFVRRAVRGPAGADDADADPGPSPGLDPGPSPEPDAGPGLDPDR